MSHDATTRRKFLYGAAAAGTVALAGCSGGGDGGGGGDGPQAPSEIDDYLGNANQYNGSLTDATGQSEVTIDVGAGANGFAFSPAAVRVDSGTTITWEWTGKGMGHNVVSVDGSATSFDSGGTVSEAGHTFQQTFDSAGVQRYECVPHATTGMLGAIDVVE